ncbi:MAG: MFS transporter [Candidatus Hodarchaeota archaeon]
MSTTRETNRFHNTITLIMKNNLYILLIQAFLFGLISSIHGTVFQPFILTLFPSLVVVGLLQSIFNFGSFSFQIFGGYFSDRLGRKKALSVVFLFSSLMGIIFLAIILFSPLDPLWTITMLIMGTLILSTGMAFYRTSGPAVAIDSSESATSETKLQNTGLILGFLLFAEFSSGIIGSVIAGVSGEEGLPFTYLVIVGISIVGIIVTLCFFKNSSKNTFTVKSERSIKSYFNIRPSLRLFYLATGTDAVGCFLILGIWFSLLVKYYNYSIADLAVISLISNVVLGFGQIPGGWLADRIKKIYMFALSELSLIIGLIIWIFSQQLLWVGVGYAFFALSVVFWFPPVYTYLGERVAKDERAFEIGKWNAYRGLIAFPIPFIGGFLAEIWGFHAPIFVSLIIICIALFFYLRISDSRIE